MKTIGLVGGMSWESTALYYQIINREIGTRLGGLRSAKLLLSSLDFEEVVARQKAGAWDELAALLAVAARGLERAGAECLLIGTNTMHRVAAEVQASVAIPLLHIADVAVAAIRDAGCRRVALLGTRYTMEQPFYVAHLARHGIECVVPNEAGRAEVHRVIFDELCKGDFNAGSRMRLAHIVERLVDGGAEGVVLGCTELSLALAKADVTVPLFDTTALHAVAAVDFATGCARAPTRGAAERIGCAVGQMGGPISAST
jgi:aspartate racemase